MTTQQVYDSVQQLSKLVLEGKALEAFDTYYHDHVVMQENEQEPTVGKAANRLREKDFYSKLVALRGAKLHKVTVGTTQEGTPISMVEWSYDYDHQDWGTRCYTQVAVQTWQDGQIIHEKFYYGS